MLQEKIINLLPSSVLVLDDDGFVHFFNRQAQELFSIDNDEARPWHEIFQIDTLSSHKQEYLQRALSSGSYLKFNQIEITRKCDGQKLVVKIEVKAFSQDSHSHGSNNKALLLIDDLTKDISRNTILSGYKQKVRQQEDELIRLDRLLTLNEMTTGFAHEINQPLTAISNYATASKYLLNAENYESVLEQLNEIVLQAERASKITQKVRNFTGSPYTKKESFSVNRLVFDSINFLKNISQESGIHIHFSKTKSACWVNGDFTQIQQVVINILKNAMDAIVDARTDEKEIAVVIENDERFVSVLISDSAGGIPEAIRESVFSPFQTTKSSGMGIGLAICQSIIDAHSGFISFDCQGPKTTFKVQLPAVQP